MPNLRTLAVALALISTAGIGGVANAASTTAANPPKTAASSKPKVHVDRKGAPGKKVAASNKTAGVLAKRDTDKKKAKDKAVAPHKAKLAKTDPKKDKHANANMKNKPKKAAGHAKPAGTDKRVARRDHVKN